MRAIRNVLIATVLFTFSTSWASADEPRLLVFISIDQARFDYFERFRPAFTGGLKYVMESGVVFKDAHHYHGVTATGPGHASLSTGLYPSHSGIIANAWLDRSGPRLVNCVEDTDAPLLRPGRETPSGSSSSGRSPKNLLGTALGDWLKEKSPLSKVFAASRKDRSAILMGGKKTDAAFWYDSGTGQFVTSRFYMKDFPAWMKRFHEKRTVDSYFGKSWSPLPVDPAKYKELEIEPLDQGAFEWSFPHPFGWAELIPDSTFYSSFLASPFMDTYMAELASVIIESESLGTDEHMDILGLGFSALDAVGHEYGPHSPEVLDVFLRLDRTLDELFQFLDDRIGMDKVAIALTSDHGVMTLPEYLKMKGEPGRRFTTEDVACIQGIEKKLDAKFGDEDWLLYDLYLHYEAINKRRLRRRDVEDELARLLEQCPPIEKVWTRTQLESSPSDPDRFFEMYQNSFHPDRSPDLYIQVKPFHLNRQDRGTTHGTPYEYDTHVPMIIVISGIAPAEIAEHVYTVDLAPTLAALLGIAAPENLDGVDRSGLMTGTKATKQ
jgi:predicted AlkP superfamily pyrophosphatase or phosphodiesterase